LCTCYDQDSLDMYSQNSESLFDNLTIKLCVHLYDITVCDLYTLKVLHYHSIIKSMHMFAFLFTTTDDLLTEAQMM
jgi:hypothetical protein